GRVLIRDLHFAAGGDADRRVVAHHHVAVGRDAVVDDLARAGREAAGDLDVAQRLVEAVRVRDVPVARAVHERRSADADVAGVDRAVRTVALTIDDDRRAP